MDINNHLMGSRRAFLKTMAIASVSCLSMQMAPELFAARAKKHRWELACRDNLLTMIGSQNCWEAMDKLGVTGVESNAARGFSSNNFFGDKKYDMATDHGLKELKADLKINKKHHCCPVKFRKG